MKENVYFVLVCDDRSLRKGGKYTETANKVKRFLDNSLNIKKTFIYDWDKIYNSNFYQKNKRLLDYVNADINGRMYKPYAILDVMKKIDKGDFIIYNDSSPELWNCLDGKVNLNKISLEQICNLCRFNKDILSVINHNSGENSGWRGGDGKHTHYRMTTPICLRKMKCEKYKDCLQHASGMMVFRKTDETLKFLEEWLFYNTIEECAGLCDIDLLEKENLKSNVIEKRGCFKERVAGNYRYWQEGLNENPYLAGHRHDQSISGLLINKRNGKLIKPVRPTIYTSYNFLEYCRKDQDYIFLN